jgi:hypothetical protein
VTTSTISNASFNYNTLTAGVGGSGGYGSSNNVLGATTVGSFAAGGQGGAALGGGVYNNSNNTSTLSRLSLSSSTLAGNVISSGAGGLGGTGTTTNGGPGGNGGNAGLAAGGGLFESNDTQLTVVNSTFGGTSSDPKNADVNRNILTGANGGRGGNAGTAGKTLTAANGGSGGAGSTLEGAGVAVLSGTATFVNDTIVANEDFVSLSNGAGGAPGGAAGSGSPGNAGANGTANGGGYFAAGLFSGNSSNPTVNNVGNTIIDLNNAGSYITGNFVLTSPDVAGIFSSLGNNVLGYTTGSSGWVSSDQTAISAAKLNIGPLLSNGGTTMTDALLENSVGVSVAIDAGGDTLVTDATKPWHNLFGSPNTDQRGIGFQRIYGKHVDVGAFEYQLPVIDSLSQNSAVEQGGTFSLTINGSDFETGATVSWSFTGSLASYPAPTLTITSITGNAITVNVPANALPDEGSANITVSVPDGSGSGQMLTSNTAPFTITDGTSITLSNPGTQNNKEGAVINGLTITSSDPDTTFNDISPITNKDSLPPGLSINPNTGVISGTIGAYAYVAGGYTVYINGVDDGTTQDTITFTWNVADTTPPGFTIPGLVNNTLTNNEGDSVNISTSPVDADAGTITASNLPPGLSIDSTTGQITGTIDTPANGGPADGTYNVSISASDGSVVGGTTFTWVVNDTAPPVLATPSNQTTKEGQQGIDLKLQSTDANKFTITGLPGEGLPGGLTYNTATGEITGTIPANAVTNGQNSQDFTVDVTATDGDNTTKNNSATTSFTWTVIDSTPPSFTIPNLQNNTLTNNEGDSVNIATNPVDADAGSITASGLPQGLTIDPTSGVISGTIGAYAAGTYNVSISGTDGTITGGTTFTWTVNDTTPPSFTISNQSSSEGDVVTNLATTPVDADGGSITASGLPKGLKIDSTSGVISGTIDKYAAGTYNVTISATDGTILGKTTFIWTVADTTPPSLTTPKDQTNNEGDKVGLQIKAVDAESFSASGLPTGLSIDANTGLISGTIDPYEAGTYKVTVTAYDGTVSSSTTFTWNVADTTPPSFTNPGTLNDNEGDAVNVNLSPVDADPNSITATGLPTGLKIDPNTGVISGTIDSRAAGTYTVTVNATDGTLTGNTTFTWNVADTTPPALANPGTQTNLDGTGASLGIHATDADSFSASGLPSGLNINPNTGVISGTILSASQTYQVTVTAYDGSASSSVTFPWVVNQVPISVAITNVQNTYVGLYQVETVTAQVTDSQGLPVNEGFVTFNLNGITFTAPVSNGSASVTFTTPMLSLDMTILLDDFFSHALTVSYSDSAGVFASSGTSLSEAGMLLDFMLFLQGTQFASLATQLAQLQNL